LHRQYVITAIGLLVVLVPIIYIKQILLAIGQDSQVIDVAAMYVYYVFPGAFLNSLAMQNVFYCSGLESTAIGLF
jgi:Na+-driven multidrug efflux pump